MSRHFVAEDIFKGIRAVGTQPGAPFFQGKFGGQAGGQFGGTYVGVGKKEFGPRGGHIKKVSPTTGKPIYYKKWSPEHGSSPAPVAEPAAGGAAPDGYHAYQFNSKHKIGRTSNGKPIYSQSTSNNTRDYMWDDHRDASHAHFSLTNHLMNLIRDRANKGKKAEGLRHLMEIHSNFALHHKKEALKDMLHGKQKALSEEDLSKRKETSGLFEAGGRGKAKKKKRNEK